MSFEECREEEDILRAITLAQWDIKHKRASSSLFRGPGTSVGRLVISSLDDLIEIFKSRLHKPPKNSLLFAGKINIGTLKSTVRENDPEKTATVIAKPEEDYLAHAEIVERLPRGISKAIAQKLVLTPIEPDE